MPPSAVSQRRTHNLLLLQKLLDLRDGASPLTILLDTLEQSSEPVVREFMLRARILKTKVVYVSFQTLRKPLNADVFIVARRKPLGELKREITSYVSSPSQVSKSLLIFDSLNPLALTFVFNLPAFLSSLLGPNISILATYHADVPIPQTLTTFSSGANPYSPDALTTLKYLATAVLRVSNLFQTIEIKKSRDRSLEEPVFGIQEGKEGVLIGLQKQIEEKLKGIVLDVEFRRKSGRGVREAYILSIETAGSTSTSSGGPKIAGVGARISLLDDHPLYAPSINANLEGNDRGDGRGEIETTFNLGLTEKQWRDREAVVSPYFDAQRDEGTGEGGRILYEMDRGDDFDDEEDEI